MDSLPPDPYKALGVSKDAELAAIRSAHRKLVLKCHPDKVQDPELKAAKQDEFQAVQEAYELLSDEKRRQTYDEKVKLFELRKEMGRGNPTPRSNPFEYEVRTAEPRTTSSTTYSRPPPKVYSQPPPRSYEDVMYEEPLRGAPRKSTSYEEKRRPATRESTREDDKERERRRWEDDERLRAKMERKSEKTVHSDKKKSRDKERRRGTEEKTRSRTTAAYVEEDSEDDYRPSPRASERRSARQRMEEEIRQREEAARAAEAAHMAQKARERERERERPTIKAASMDPKWNEHMERAGQYMQAAKKKVNPEFQHPGMPRRAETFAPTSATYNIRYATPQQYSDEDSPKRSSARKESRRSSETPARASSRDKSKSSRRSPPAHPRDAYIVEPPSPPPIKKPSLQTHSSAPPIIPTRKEPSRSKTQDYPRTDKVPPLPRAQTFHLGGDKGRERGGSRLKQQVYTDSESESDSPVYATRRSHSPPPRRAPEPTRYVIDNGRSVPIKTRSSEYRSSDNDPYVRERSESPRGTAGRHSAERTQPSRHSSERPRATPTRSQSQAYYSSEVPQHPADPIILTARPKMPPREGSHHRSQGGGSGGAYFGEVNYGPSYGPENIIYANHPPVGGSPPDAWRRGSDPSHHRAYESYSRGGREQVYA